MPTSPTIALEGTDSLLAPVELIFGMEADTLAPSPFYRARNAAWGSILPNVLLSTTRMWNCGDDFISFGVRNLLTPLLGQFNPVAYNRNPDLHSYRFFAQAVSLKTGDQTIQADMRPVISNYVWKSDNSWRLPKHNETLDLVVFAGTPEWQGGMVAPLIDSLAESDIPVLYLGIGAFEKIRDQTFEQVSEADRQLLGRARLVTVRDPICERILAPLKPLQMPCPALFSSNQGKPRTGKPRIALCTQGRSDESRQPINDVAWKFSVALFNQLAKRYDCTVVCHYIDELAALKAVLDPSLEFRYSYDARDYEDIYAQCNFSVTTRVHGAGLCASLGIPSFVIGHSTPSATVDGFLSRMIDPAAATVDGVLTDVENFDIALASRRLLAHKRDTKARFLRLIEQALDGSGLL